MPAKPTPLPSSSTRFPSTCSAVSMRKNVLEGTRRGTRRAKGRNREDRRGKPSQFEKERTERERKDLRERVG
eukprot:2583709-Rhodomonas_salina.1